MNRPQCFLCETSVLTGEGRREERKKGEREEEKAKEIS